MSENLVLIVSSLAAFSYTLISVLSFRRALKDIVYLWLGLIFFAPFLSFVSNLLIYFRMGHASLLYLAMIFNLSWGAYLVLFIYNLGNTQKRVFNPWLFLPSVLYLPFMVYSIINPGYVNEFVSGNMHGIYLTINSAYNGLMLSYSILSNIVLLILTARRLKISRVHKIRAEILTVMLILQLLAFVPYFLKLDPIFLIMYMPLYGLIFFIYAFVRLTSGNASFIQPILKEKYTGIYISDERKEELSQKILRLMAEKKPFLDEDCSLQRIANDLDELPNTISMIINSHFNKSFSDFINGYRVQWSIQLLQQGSQKYTIEGIAFECGFGNRTSFYKAFRKETGKLPRDYMVQRKTDKGNDGGWTMNAGTQVK